MQTFLPYSDYYKSLSCLDPKRLGNQVYREGKTLASGGWPNHPASKMWVKNKRSLCDYCIIGLEVLNERGKYYPHWFDYFGQLREEFEDTGFPSWLGNEEFHASHRSNLLRKDPIYYGQFGWTEPDNLEYVWPLGG